MNLGGRDLDYVVMREVSDKFKEEFDLEENPHDDKKRCIRMLDAVEKGRKALSADTEADVKVDTLMDDEDLDITVERYEFEDWIQEYTDELKGLLTYVSD